MLRLYTLLLRLLPVQVLRWRLHCLGRPAELLRRRLGLDVHGLHGLLSIPGVLLGLVRGLGVLLRRWRVLLRRLLVSCPIGAWSRTCRNWC